MSLPPRERGLKQQKSLSVDQMRLVAPPAGAWIETYVCNAIPLASGVAPPAGAWIETEYSISFGTSGRSLPPRERGLKQAASARR